MKRPQSLSVPFVFSLAGAVVGVFSSGCGRQQAAVAPPIPGAVGKPVANLGAENAALSLCWSPDGRMLASHVETLENGEPIRPSNDTVHIWNLAKDAEAFSSSGPFDANPTWIPDGSAIVYMSSSVDRKTSQLATVSPGDSRVHLITGSYRNFISGCDGVWRDADTLVFFDRDEGGPCRIRTWNRKTNTFGTLWETPGQDGIVPTVSPDGKKLAYVDKAAKPRRLIVVDLTLKKVLFSSKPHDGMVVEHAWTHTPNRLVYASETENGAELHRVSLGTRADKVIAKSERFVTPIAVRKTNDDIAVTTVGAQQTGPRLHVYSIDGKLLAISPNDMEAAAPAWSSDGARLAYCASAHKPMFFRVYVAEADAVTSAWKPN